MDNMILGLKITLGIIALYVTANHGIHVVIICGFAVGAVYAFFHEKIKMFFHTRKLKEYAAMTNDIFESSRYEDDRNVRRRAQEHRYYLEESRKGADDKKIKIMVYELYFGDADHYGETVRS